MDSQLSAYVASLTEGMDASDKLLVESALARTDTGYLKGDLKNIKDAFKSIVKTMKFLGFFGDSVQLNTTDKKGNKRPCLDCFGDVMADRLKHGEHDRDLIVMQHKFVIEDENKK